MSNGEERAEIDRSLLVAQLANAVALRSAQDQVLWVIIGTFWATNAILLVALFQTGGFPEMSTGITLGAVGFTVSAVWFGMQRRALAHLVRYEELARDLELALGVPPGLALSAEINREAYDRIVGGGIKARQFMRLFTIGTAVAWLVTILIAAVTGLT